MDMSPIPENLPADTPKQPAITITISSKMIPVIGLLLLLIGFAGGYFGQPWISSHRPGTTSSLTAGTVEPQTTQSSVPDQNSRDAMMQALIAQTKHFRGDPQAPITMIEFADFQCPFCGKHFAEAGQQIEEQYVKSGLVRVGYWHFAFLGPESIAAAEASECAGDQDAFFEYHDVLFNSQNGENKGAFNSDNLKQFAVDLGLNSAAFNDCLDSGKYSNFVKSMTDNARQLGVQSTPTFLINGEPIIGAQPFSAFQQVIESLR